MDRVAHLIGMDPLEFRLKNALRDGDANANGQKVYGTGITACLEALRPAWAEPFERRPGPKLSRGRGIGTALMPIGLTGGSGGNAAAIKILNNGQVAICMGLTEVGQGIKTIFPQLVAEILRVPEESVVVTDADTAVVPAAASPGASQADLRQWQRPAPRAAAAAGNADPLRRGASGSAGGSGDPGQRPHLPEGRDGKRQLRRAGPVAGQAQHHADGLQFLRHQV